MLIIRGVNVFPSQIEGLILKDPHLSPHYVLELYRRDRLDALEVVVEPRADVGAYDDATRNACATNLAHEIKSYVGITATVRVVDIGDIERSIGKANRILDMRPKK
jgi:phenylacetate-CoA ligase